jgi:hypothetical protein
MGTLGAATAHLFSQAWGGVIYSFTDSYKNVNKLIDVVFSAISGR